LSLDGNIKLCKLVLFIKIYFESTMSSQIHVSGKLLRTEIGASTFLAAAIICESAAVVGPLGPPGPPGPPGPKDSAAE
jgi:hypothetical protein